MGCDLTSYRARIGSFVMPKYKPRRYARYTPYTRGSDIHLRTVVTSTVILAIMLSALGLLVLKSYASSCLSVANITISNQNSVSPFGGHDFNGRHQTVSPENQLYQAYSGRLILLSADVELNPGPGPEMNTNPSPETQVILMAISNSTAKMTEQIMQVKHEVHLVQADMHSVKQDVSKLKSTVERVDYQITEHERRLKECEIFTSQSASQCDYNKEMLRSDFDSLDIKANRQEDQIAKLEDTIDRLEGDIGRNNLRIFGVPDSDQEDSATTKTLICEKVFSVIPEDQRCEASCIESARRIGKFSANSARMILVRFTSLSEKLKIFGVRDELRQNGIRVANELTSRQREFLRYNSEKGIKGYFKNGKFCEFKNNTHRNNSAENNERVYMRAVRPGNRQTPPAVSGSQNNDGANRDSGSGGHNSDNDDQVPMDDIDNQSAR